MVGPPGLPGGFPLAHFAAKYRGEDPGELPPFVLADGLMVLGAVVLRIEAGRTRTITRVR